MQFQSDVLGCELHRPQNPETTALGAAYLAGLAVGFWKDTDALKALRSSDDVFTPKMSRERAEQLLREQPLHGPSGYDWEDEIDGGDRQRHGHVGRESPPVRTDIRREDREFVFVVISLHNVRYYTMDSLHV